ncbi:cytochrome c oxidase subunit 8B, mitochondrial-like [Pseudorasbora parva]|uniref:cytochrome c oxidase subunit 8B, mitochondrial-like n=1 Tax=Pseudorasbora parva TaxID=51549 RepID=UPI00351E4EFB
MMFGFVRALRSTIFTPSHHAFTQRFYITSKPAKGKVGVVESAFVMAFICITVLGPAGWILSNSSNSHKKKQ